MESQRHPGREADREGALFSSRWVRLHARCLRPGGLVFRPIHKIR